MILKPRAKITCDWCGAVKERAPSQIKGSKHHFCSIECHGNWQKENLIGENNPNYGKSLSKKRKEQISERTKKTWRDKKSSGWKKEQVELTCLLCGKKFYDYPCHAKKRKYCSHRCAREANKSLTKKNMEKLLKNLNVKPNKFEKRIDNILKNHFAGEFAFNGDFSAGVSIGRQIPDFVNCNSKKCVIECFGEVFHGGIFTKNWRRTEFGRKAIYSQYGYECLIIWFNESKKRTDETIAKDIQEFMEGVK